MSVGKRLRRSLWSVPLGLQLAILYTLLLVGTLILLGTLLYSQLDRFLVDNTAVRLNQTANSVLSRLESGDRGPRPESDPNHIIPDLVRGLSGPDVLVEVRDEQGVVIAFAEAVNGSSLPAMPALPEGWLATLETSSSPARLVLTAPEGGRRLVVIAPIVLPGRGAPNLRIYLVQAASLSAADDILGQLRLYILLGIIGGTLLGVPAGLFLTRLVLRPLGRVARTADAIAAGDTSRRLNLPPGSNEVARLGGAFDQMMDRLASTLEAQRRFVADASHEIRTPLTSLEGLSEMLLIGADKGDPRIVQRTLRSMHGELGRLRRLVADLLTLSRLDSATPMALSTIDACALFSDVAEQMAPVADRKGVTLSVECAECLKVRADQDRLKQVVLNLVDNAIRYSPQEGVVRLVGARGPSPARVRLQISDQGPGISPADLPHIFDRFYRSDTSRTRETGNAGLGLAIARAITEAHGGTITVESTAQGATFNVLLPAAVETPSPVASK